MRSREQIEQRIKEARGSLEMCNRRIEAVRQDRDRELDSERKVISTSHLAELEHEREQIERELEQLQYAIALPKSGPVLPIHCPDEKKDMTWVDEQHVRQIVEESFDLDSLERFCWDYLKLKIENIKGRTLEDKVFHLFRWAEREGRMNRLVTALKDRFPAESA